MGIGGNKNTNLEKHLEEVRSFNRQRLSILEEECNKMLEEKNELERYLNKLLEEISGLHSYAVLELAVQRLENICITLLKAADENSRIISENAGIKIKQMQSQVRELDSQIEEAKAEIKRELSFFNNNRQSPSSQSNPDLYTKTFDKYSYQETAASSLFKQEFVSIKDQAGNSAVEDAGTEESESKVNYETNLETPEGLRSTIEEARYKYMIGKIAGEPLLDNSGEVIIEKNRSITIEHIEKAKHEGKLSELIINMMIPGMDRTK